MDTNRQLFNPPGIASTRNQLLAFALIVHTTVYHQWRLWRGNGIGTWPYFEAGSSEPK